MSSPLSMEGLDGLSLAQEGERLCRQNNFKAGIRYLEMALKRGVNADNESMEAVSAIYSQLGNAYFAIKDFEMALHYHRLDIETAKLLHDNLGLAKAHGNLGNAYKAIGDFKNALENSMQHLNIAQEIGDKECESRALYNVGSILYCRAKTRLHACFHLDEGNLNVDADPVAASDLHSAVDYYLRNLRIVEDLKDWAACGRTYGNLGNCYYMLGDYKTAVDYHNKRLSLARRFGDRAAMKRAYTNLGNAFIFLKQTAKAVEYYRLALDMAVELKDEIAEAQCCFNAGNGSAICNEHSTAAEYHVRYLRISRRLQDRAEEITACASLGADYRSLGDRKKAAYFYALGMELAFKAHDHTTEMAMRNSFECLYRTHDSSISKDICNLFELDSSADPDPRPLSQLNTSVQSLLHRSDCSDCGLSRRGISDLSAVTSGPEEMPHENDGIDEDFIELLSRMQCKRINDQRCDPDMLADVTNRTNGSVRQSDTLTCTGARGDASNITQRARRRFSVFFERFGKRYFRPTVASTPLQRPTSMIRSLEDHRRVGKLYSDSSAGDMSALDTRSVKSENVSKDTAKDSTSTIPSPVFRVPAAPARKIRPRSCSTISLDTGIAALQPSKQEGMLDLIANLQGRRMEEQRAVLNGQDGGIDESLSQNGEIEVFEDAGQLYDLVIRSQGDRLDEQRSELAITQPDEDVSQIVLDMQKGRIQGQRASLEPRGSN